MKTAMPDMKVPRKFAMVDAHVQNGNHAGRGRGLVRDSATEPSPNSPLSQIDDCQLERSTDLLLKIHRAARCIHLAAGDEEGKDVARSYGRRTVFGNQREIVGHTAASVGFQPF